MGRKSKPKWGWKGTASFSLHPISDEGIKELAKSLGRSQISEEISLRLQEIAANHNIWKEFFSTFPHPRELRAALQEIKKRAGKLLDCLKNIDRLTIDKLAAASKDAEISEIIENQSVKKIYDASERALRVVKIDRGGRKPQYGMKDAISRMADLFEGVTKKKAVCLRHYVGGPARGDFFEFVKTFFLIVDMKAYYSDIALRLQIERALKEKRKKKSS